MLQYFSYASSFIYIALIAVTTTARAQGSIEMLADIQT
jgi:hypothetical protein